MEQKERQYCLLMDGRKYHRNAGCKRHDNAYGIRGGGDESVRRAADHALYTHMCGQGDPLAALAFTAVRCFGWFYFNYHGRPWNGQLVRMLSRRY